MNKTSIKTWVTSINLRKKRKKFQAFPSLPASATKMPTLDFLHTVVLLNGNPSGVRAFKTTKTWIYQSSDGTSPKSQKDEPLVSIQDTCFPKFQPNSSILAHRVHSPPWNQAYKYSTKYYKKPSNILDLCRSLINH